jgi:hypothetical protein
MAMVILGCRKRIRNFLMKAKMNNFLFVYILDRLREFKYKSYYSRIKIIQFYEEGIQKIH